MSNKPTETPEQINTVRRLYADGMTQREVADKMAVSTKRVFGIMRRQGIKPRRSVIRNQRKDKNKYWKGDAAGKSAMHKRIEQLFGKPKNCEICKISGGLWVVYEWANLTGKYNDPLDYKRMCRSCHRKYDKGHLNFKSALGGVRRKEVQHA